MYNLYSNDQLSDSINVAPRRMYNLHSSDSVNEAPCRMYNLYSSE